MITKVNNLYSVGPTLSPVRANNSSTFFQQKSLLSLKSEWSSEYIYWSELLDIYTKLCQNKSLMDNSKSVSLVRIVKQLSILLKSDHQKIGEEINLVLKWVHDPEIDGFDGYELTDRYWDLKNDIFNFRKQARRLQLIFLREIPKNIPLHIF